jgi:hypothetical protein
VKERQQPIQNRLVFTYAIGMAIFHLVGAGVWGFAHTLPQINYYTHGSQVTVSHGHMALRPPGPGLRPLTERRPPAVFELAGPCDRLKPRPGSADGSSPKGCPSGLRQREKPWGSSWKALAKVLAKVW